MNDDTLDISDLCPIAREVARRQVERLRLGQRTKGPWLLGMPRTKTWRREKMEELQDFFIYEFVDEIEEEMEGQLFTAIYDAGEEVGP